MSETETQQNGQRNLIPRQLKRAVPEYLHKGGVVFRNVRAGAAVFTGTEMAA
jgi:hypothetical protein